MYSEPTSLNRHSGAQPLLHPCTENVCNRMPAMLPINKSQRPPSYAHVHNARCKVGKNRAVLSSGIYRKLDMHG